MMANSLLNFPAIVQLIGVGEAVDSQLDIEHFLIFIYNCGFIYIYIYLASKEIMP